MARKARKAKPRTSKQTKFVIELVITVKPLGSQMYHKPPVKKDVQGVLDFVLQDLDYVTSIHEQWSYRIRSVDYD